MVQLWPAAVNALRDDGHGVLADCLSQARPVVIYQALPGQEGGNVTLIERSGAGCYIPDVDALARAVAARPRALPTANTAQAAWWGGAARRVAARLLAARAEARDDSRQGGGRILV